MRFSLSKEVHLLECTGSDRRKPVLDMATAHRNAFVRSHLMPDSTAKAHIRELLRSNAPPPDNLASTISELSRELTRYNDEIARIRAQLTDMESECLTLQTHHDACLSLLAPIRRCSIGNFGGDLRTL
ncbi:hypothetical protein K438DRAFT_609832 [Mycena galopus ATCC 62051]|nr:hypothetical protein K438DRAFT_609832 [Mycena galopus ATCC 62051]